MITKIIGYLIAASPFLFLLGLGVKKEGAPVVIGTIVFVAISVTVILLGLKIIAGRF